MVAGIISQAIARTSSDFDTARSMTSRPTGDIMRTADALQHAGRNQEAECRRLRTGNGAQR